jgi:K+-transporting ATPase ATPase A chain
MTLEGWALIALFVLIIAAIARPIGLFLAAVYEGRRTLLSPLLAPVEQAFYAAAGVKPDQEQSWRGYAAALVMFSVASTLLLFAILRFQNILPLNPQGFDAVPSGVAMNTAISFVTNTNWQAYGGVK